MESDSLQLQELVPAEPFVPSPGWPWWVWVAIVLVVCLSVLLIFALRRKSRATTPPDLGLVAETAFKAAIKHIEQAAKHSAIQEAATACSAAIRRYLATVTGDSSLYETHEEFLARHEALTGYPIEVRDGVATGFCRLAQLKYGKAPSGDPAAIADEGRSLLQQLHQNRPA